MTYRKTWFSYVLWVLYAGLCVMMLTFASRWFMLYTGTSSFVPVFVVSIFLIFPVLMGIYIPLRVGSCKIRTKYNIQAHTLAMFEAFVVASCFVFGTLYRLRAALVSTLDNSFLGSLETEYFEMAVVRAGEKITPMTHGIGYLYVACLSVVMSFLGNKILSAMFLQAVLQIISLVLGYLVIRKSAGRLPACVALIYLAFSSAYVSRIGVIDPECFYFLFYLLGMYLIVSIVKNYCRNDYVKSFAVWVFMLLGIVLGLLIYLDIRSVTLLFFLTGIFTGKKEEDEELPPIHVGQNILVFGVAEIFCVLTFFAAFLVDALCYGTEYMAELSAWGNFYLSKSWGGILACMEQFMKDFPVNILLIMAASFLVFEFKRSGKEQNYTLWILLCVCTAPTPMTGYGVLPYGTISLFIWCVLAGLGLQNCIMGGSAQVVQAKIEEINAAAQVQIEETEKPRFIENPLPLPKKHVRREMDYEYPVAQEDMKFDIEVDEADDFDI